MVQKPRAVKSKVIAGYLLLFSIAVISVWFVYDEIVKISRISQADWDNKQIIKISNVIAGLYASEALGRSAIITGSGKDYKAYNVLLDSINLEIKSIRDNVEENQRPKFDSIKLLLQRKRKSTAEIIKYRNTTAKNNTLRRAISGIYIVKDSIKNTVQPVKTTKKYPWNELVSAVLTPQQRDSLSKLPVSNDSLALAFDKVLADLLSKEKRVINQLSRKEEKLLEENRIISDKLRAILSAVENEFLQNSYAKIRRSQAAISKTTEIIAWVGAGAFLLLIVFAVIIVRDLTSQQNYRKQLEVLNRENEDLLRSKSMLMATVTHDLQTPLGSILGFHDLLRASGINAKQGQYLSNIKESAGYIQKLVNDLLDFSKLENNRITIEQSPFNFSHLIDSTCRTLEPIAINKNIELTWDIDEELNAVFLSDPYRIRQVLTNLISNAIKFTSEGSVEVTGRLESGTIYVSVLDTGIGIAKDRHDDVFKEFTQAHAGIEKKFGGTGLGLTISKKMLELLGGKIRLESAEGQGSIFTIQIPAVYADVVEAVHVFYDNGLAGYLRGRKLLVVDDDNVQLMLVKELLSAYSLSVHTEINSAVVVALLEAENFDLVITDIQMPVLDGFALIEKIRSHHNPVVANVPVIALSGRRDLHASDFTGKGFTAHHPKPVQVEGLVLLISKVFGNTAYEEAHQAPLIVPRPLYSLKSLSGFTNNDPASLNTILRTFIKSAEENCRVLAAAAQNNDVQSLAETAHKMIPMLKQMEIHTIADLLMPLEEMTLTMQNHDLEAYIDDIRMRVAVLIEKLTLEIT
ncbi:hypothetical protein CHU92_08905 [Flavobacterium cyanobacteriorum]|uniref:histidine kinase n=1 Tax=Flavobacterium cyanobacteriorum TaxID=2022802 RepID=A0A255Z6Q7_9FLAO|nr:hybrid sensor histidine kinase/response regulator [Flavobacterium cyanobacteriorum]OYQ37111.1 hypothetical protein CHU92_08905 [Flavobacterium cyanobacteriorum]